MVWKKTYWKQETSSFESYTYLQLWFFDWHKNRDKDRIIISDPIKSSNEFLLFFHSWNWFYHCNFLFYGDSKRIKIWKEYTFCRNCHFFSNRSNFPKFKISFLCIFVYHIFKKSIFLYLQFATKGMLILWKCALESLLKTGH